jgi:hypothetical protein
MPENGKWSKRWAKGVVECEQLYYALRPQSKVHIQSWSFVSYCGISVKDMSKLELLAYIKVRPHSISHY